MVFFLKDSYHITICISKTLLGHIQGSRLFLENVLSVSYSPFTAGEHRTDAPVHSNPDRLPCRIVDCQVQPSITCTALHPHPHHPTAHVYDRASLY